ncbi:MAG: M20/M25/M40 family metallo-hydrolase, partial [Thermomicrobiales bacterium]|nr:M20/M25/M40 family metallo-hydrolase [Thermomicrobiales bacterium]
GVSALQKGVTVYQALVELNTTVNQRTHPLVPPSKIAVNALQAGYHWAIVPDRCVVKADRRIIPGETVEGTVAEMEALLDRLRQADPALDVTMEIDTSLPPIETPTDSLIVQEAVAAVAEVKGAPPQLKGIKGFTELVHIYQAGIPGIVLGPGSPSVIHAANEYVPLQEYMESIGVYTSLARRITSRPASREHACLAGTQESEPRP